MNSTLVQCAPCRSFAEEKVVTKNRMLRCLYFHAAAPLALQYRWSGFVSYH
jgi:hypothetical protein